MSDRAAELRAALDAALDAAAVVEALARATWYNAHDDAECPAHRVPTPADLAAWLPKCPPKDRAEADARLSALLGRPAAWFSITYNGTPALYGVTRAELQPGVLVAPNDAGGWDPVIVADDLIGLHVRLSGVEPERRPPHPAAPLVAAWQETSGGPPSTVQAVTLRHAGRDHLRTPGLMAAAALAPVSTVVMDGEPFGSAAPVRMLRKVPLPDGATDPDQLELLPGPRTLDGAAVDPVLSVLSGMDDWRDGRSPLRSDVLTLVRLGCAVLAPVRLDVDGWARVLRGKAGRVQTAARFRAQQALSAGAVIVWHDGRAYQMVRAVTGTGGTVDVLPAAGAGWWDGGRGGADAWRLSGGLWRRHWTGPKQGGHRRMAEGIEAALAWSPPAGRVKNGRLPQATRPDGDRAGNPGPEYFIGWQRLLYLSGEPYPDAADLSARRTYQRRMADFETRGYKAKGRAAAPAGDTWEITKRVKGGLLVRASARYVEAVRLSQRRQNFTTVSLDLLLRQLE